MEVVGDDELELFQSRNRGSFDFKEITDGLTKGFGDLFRSRNRGSFDFK